MESGDEGSEIDWNDLACESGGKETDESDEIDRDNLQGGRS